MPALSSAELAAMRDIIESELLPDTCDILSVSRTPDGQGGNTETWGTASADVPFRLDSRIETRETREQVTGGALQPFSEFVGSLPYDTTISSENRILHNGVTYACKPSNTGQSWVAVRRVLLEKIE